MEGGYRAGTLFVTLKKNHRMRKIFFMRNDPNSLPLRALMAFRSAGEHLSFTRAAGDLNVTREAISLQIRALEQYLGVKLFELSLIHI